MFWLCCSTVLLGHREGTFDQNLLEDESERLAETYYGAHALIQRTSNPVDRLVALVLHDTTPAYKRKIFNQRFCGFM